MWRIRPMRLPQPVNFGVTATFGRQRLNCLSSVALFGVAPVTYVTRAVIL